MERDTVYLHIGASKSGSTWLQRSLSDIRRQLHDARVLYPGNNIDHYFEVCSLLGIAFGYDETADSEPIDVWNALAQEVREWPHVSIISHELLSWATPNDVRRSIDALAPKHVEVIYTLRDLGRVLPSHWQEDVKNNCKARFDQWLDRLQDPNTTNNYAKSFWKFQDPSKALNAWCSIIKPEHVHVVLVPNASIPGDSLWDRFAHILGFNPSLLKGNTLFRNTSMSWGETEVIRRINIGLQGTLQWRHHHDVVKWMLANDVYTSRTQADDIAISLPTRYIEWVRSVAQKQKDFLLSSGVHIIGNLEELNPIINEAGKHEGPSDEQIASAAIDGLVAMIRELSSERDKAVTTLNMRQKKSNAGVNNNSLFTGYSIRRIRNHMQRAWMKLFGIDR